MRGAVRPPGIAATEQEENPTGALGRRVCAPSKGRPAPGQPGCARPWRARRQESTPGLLVSALRLC